MGDDSCWLEWWTTAWAAYTYILQQSDAAPYGETPYHPARESRIFGAKARWGENPLCYDS